MWSLSLSRDVTMMYIPLRLDSFSHFGVLCMLTVHDSVFPLIIIINSNNNLNFNLIIIIIIIVVIIITIKSSSLKLQGCYGFDAGKTACLGPEQDVEVLLRH